MNCPTCSAPVCANCGRRAASPTPNGTDEPLCEFCRVAALNHGHYSAVERGTLTRGEAIDAIAECETLDALRELSVAWIGHPQDGITDIDALADLLQGYVDEACMAQAGDDIRSNGPKDSDDTGLPT